MLKMKYVLFFILALVFHVTLAKKADLCTCYDNTGCSCCTNVRLPAKHTVCGNVTYNAATNGADFALGFDGKYETTAVGTGKNPPPICYGPLPLSSNVAGLCAELTKMKIKKNEKTGVTKISGCVNAFINLATLMKMEKKLGCFKFFVNK